MEKLIEQKAREMVEKTTPNLETPKFNLTVDETKSYGEQAKEYVDVLATKNAIQDEQLGEELTDTKKQELKIGAQANLQKEKAKAKLAEVEIQNAEYDSYNGVATYAGIKKPLPKKMQKILFTTLAFFQMIWLILIGIPTSIITITADAIDNIISKMSKIAKSSRVLLLTLMGIVTFGGIGYIVWLILQNYNIIG
jgi:hypothetical protein